MMLTPIVALNSSQVRCCGDNLGDGWRLAGVYVGKILNGAKPADLPVQDAVKVELAINMKTANTSD